MAVAGYAIMRLGLVALWLRAAAHDPPRRRTAVTYVVGIPVVQLLWVARLWVPVQWSILLVGAILAGAVAEHVVRSGPLATA